MNFLSKLNDMLMVGEKALTSFILTSPHRYKKYEIDKRNGKGKRLIAHPSKQLKYIQRLLVKELEEQLPVHESAMAYKKGVGIKNNALAHKDSKYLLKMDFKDFFYRITPEMFFKAAASKGLHYSESDKLVLSHLLFFRLNRNSPLTLSIGAPSSPLISNYSMNLFDEAISNYCAELKVTYTRYADDIVFSTNSKNVLFSIPKKVEETLKSECFGCVKVNTGKTVFSSKAHNRHVTGITISNEGKLSLGRERKRKISSLVHKFGLGLLNAREINELRGLLAFASDIEPLFLARLRGKYGSECLNSIRNYKQEE